MPPNRAARKTRKNKFELSFDKISIKKKTTIVVFFQSFAGVVGFQIVASSSFTSVFSSVCSSTVLFAANAFIRAYLVIVALLT